MAKVGAIAGDPAGTGGTGGLAGAGDQESYLSTLMTVVSDESLFN